jgi:hypothetical protein
MQFMTTASLPFESIENDFLRVDYLTTTGPRIIGLYAKGVKSNLLAETPNVHWSTPYGEYYLRGGHRLWNAPENPFYTCPEDNVNVIAEKDTVIMRSNIDAAGLEKEISFRLDENCVALTHRITWHGNDSIELAPWAITQLRLESMAILPQSNVDGLQPNRKFVFWPYSKINDARLELHDDLILIHGRVAEQPFKIGSNNPYGWIACTLGNALFVKRFSVDHAEKYPDMGCNAEAYVKDSCIELETLGPLRILKPNETVTHEETWEVIAGDYPPTLETARQISKQLSQN